MVARPHHVPCILCAVIWRVVPKQEKRSAYAPSEEQPVRYDGIYRIVRAYRKPGAQKQLVCRYLFIRCDNEPAPWSSEGGALNCMTSCLAQHNS